MAIFSFGFRGIFGDLSCLVRVSTVVWGSAMSCGLVGIDCDLDEKGVYSGEKGMLSRLRGCHSMFCIPVTADGE